MSNSGEAPMDAAKGPVENGNASSTVEVSVGEAAKAEPAKVGGQTLDASPLPRVFDRGIRLHETLRFLGFIVPLKK